MRFSLLEKVSIEKSLIYIIIVAVLITFVFIFYLFFSHFTRKIELLAPIGGEEWEVGATYQISWKARGIDKIGIVLFKGTEPRWIAKNVHAVLGQYQWKIRPGQQYGDDYWIAVFEYPWKKKNKIAYSGGAFAIVYPELATCDGMSIQEEWPYVPSDLPSTRRVFITPELFKGDLGGLDGANTICQQSAQNQGFEGTWHAFLGGDSDQDLAVERLDRTPRKTTGVFVEAKPSATLLRGATCHRLLGGDFSEFLNKLSARAMVNEEKLGGDFFTSLGNVWLGRLDGRSKKNCTEIPSVIADVYMALAEKYSFTTTCQNWTREEKYVEGYPVPMGEPKPPFSTCYTPQGTLTDAVASGGLATGLVGWGNDRAFIPYEGKYCNNSQHLLCIEE